MTEIPPSPRHAVVEDAAVVAQLLHDFNREFDEPTPPVSQLTERMAELIASGESVVLLVGESPDGLAVMRFRPAIWSSGLECYLAELYVRAPRRGHGLGRALMEAAIREARERGADTMEIGVDEPDLVARRIYESLGFSNRSGGSDGPIMYVYELDLKAAT
jgi:GNAT superfamily N-acetyltransferase